MTPDRWSRINAIFGEALDLAAAERESHVAQACGGDTELRDEILDLLKRHDRPDAFVDRLMAPPGTPGLMTFQAGKLISGRFRIERFIGEGGMGEVYAALDTELGTRVALKTMHPHLASERFADRFRREVHLARQVTHPSVCRIYDAGRDGSTLYLTMELLEGETLAARLSRGGVMSTGDALPIIRQLCAGLEAAHAAGIVHRDLKSGNVILAGERAVITDFGLARLVEPEAGAGVSTAVAIGTPAYMAPEQMEGATAGPAADIYALGVVIYEMLTGHRPFEDASPLVLAVKKSKDPPAPPRRWVDLPVAWESVILKCLALRPEDRFADAGEIVAALDGGKTVRVRAQPRSNRWRWLVAAACACAAAGWGLSAVNGARQRPPAAVEAWYREGVHALHDGNPATARRALMRATAIAPAWAPGHARLAQAYVELDQPDLARVSVLQALQVKAWFDPGANLVNAVQSQLAQDFPAAAKGFGKIAASQSGADRLDALLDQARALEQGEKPVEAAHVAGEILTASPEAPAANLMQALLGIRMNDTPAKIRPRFDKAIEGFRTLNRIEALSQGELELSKWLLRQKDANTARQRAEASLTSARAAQSPYAEAQALFQLARIADATADRAHAEAYLAQAREIANREHFSALIVEGFIGLGLQRLTQNKIAMALSEFQNGVVEADRFRSQRGRARALYQSGRALTQLARFPEALAIFPQAEQLQESLGFPREALRTRLGEAFALSRSGEYPKAAAILKDVQSRAGALGDVELQLLAIARMGSYSADIGELPAALESFRTWLRLANEGGLDDDACSVQSSIARQLLNLGEFVEARSMLQGLVADPRCQQPHHVTQRGLVEGMFLTEEGRFTEALVHYRSMLAMARANKQTIVEGQLKNVICTTSVLVEPPRQAREVCGPMIVKPAEAREAESSLYVSADLFLREGNFAEAVHLAELARAKLAHGNLDDTVYATLIRGQAEARSGDRPAVAATRLELNGLRARLVERWGEPVVAKYLTRPLYARRWNEVFGAFKQQ